METKDQVIKLLGDAMYGFTGWDWNHDPGGLVVSGPGAVADWNVWEASRAADLVLRHPIAMAERLASAEREYGERIQLAAEAATCHARLAITHIQADNLPTARAHITEAIDLEAQFGDAPTYQYVLDQFDELTK